MLSICRCAITCNTQAVLDAVSVFSRLCERRGAPMLEALLMDLCSLMELQDPGAHEPRA